MANNIHVIGWFQWSWNLNSCVIEYKALFPFSKESALHIYIFLISESSSLYQSGHPWLCYSSSKYPLNFRGLKERKKQIPPTKKCS